MKRHVLGVLCLAAAFAACFNFDEYATSPSAESAPGGPGDPNAASAGEGAAVENSAGSAGIPGPVNGPGPSPERSPMDLETGPNVQGVDCVGADCPAGQLLGQTCDDAASCASGFCARDAEDVARCCDTTCDGVCERCGSDGSCNAAASADARCEPVTCPADDACRDFDDIPAGTCAAAGTCASAADCSFAWKPAAREGAACSPDGDRFVLNVGEACGSGPDCAVGCYATASSRNICCSEACAPNEVCSEDGSGCDLAAVCTNGTARCSGSSYQRCTAGQWVTETECGAVGCNLAQNGCLRGVGDACNSTADCGVGACRPSTSGGNICCTASCNGSCQRCAPSGTACSNLADDASCGVIQCPADETCRDYPASATANRCRDGRCGTAGQLCPGAPRNVGQSCSSANTCDNAGNCSVPKKALGIACTTNGECSSNVCSQNVCCNQACDGLCETCDTTGQCRAAADDADCAPVLCAGNGRSAACAANFTNITTNRCQGRGVCKTEAECGFNTALCTTTNGDSGVCSQGLCQLRIVRCGNTDCPVSNRAPCCIPTNGTAPRCGGTCDDGFTAVCDQQSDCSAGTTCGAGAVGGALVCQNAAAVPGFLTLCESPAISLFGGFNGCLDCNGSSPATGWRFCGQ